MSKVDEFMLQAKKDGKKILLFQMNPPRIVFTEKDGEMPDAFGAALAYAAAQMATVDGASTDEHLETLVVLSVARAKELLRKNRPGQN